MEGHSRDFSEVDSLEKAQALCSAGKLERLYLFPVEFGGQEIPQNTLYVAIGIAAIKKQIDGTIQDLVNAGQVSSYVAEPEYKGSSFVPSKIRITAAHPEKSGGLNPIIDIW
jgi:hypothetical protein